jgi:radical SAM superfamily enzyme YgiQ (UPF0313 family)
MIDCIIIAAGPTSPETYSQIQRNLGSYRIASALENAGYTSRVIDFTQYFTVDEIIQALSVHISDNTLWVGFSSTFFWGDQTLFPHMTPADVDKLFQYIKQFNVQLIYGGVRSLWASDDRIDTYILGYADDAIIEYTKGVADGLQQPKVFDSKQFPEPKMDNIKTHWWRKDFSILDGESLPLELARGCIFKCKFCGYSLIGKKKGTYLRDIEEVRDDLIKTWEATGCTNYYITDDTFNDDNDKIEAIHKLFTSLPFKINFSCYLRLDLLNKYPHQADLLQEAGLVGNFFGVETFNKQSGIAIGKSLAPNKVKDRLYWLKEKWNGKVNIGIGLIYGLPYDTVEYFEETNKWILEKDNPVDDIGVYPLVLFKKNKGDYGSEFSLNPEIYGYKIEDNNFWTLESQRLDYNIVSRYANAINHAREPMNKVSEFQIMTVANLGIKIDEILKLRYNELESKYNVSSINKMKLQQYKRMIGVRC